MKGIEIYLAEEDYEGAMIMKCSSSPCLAVRAEKSDAQQYNEINAPGIYFLLVDSDSVYVGQSGLDTVSKRIMNTHSGSIDSSWHTVVAFVDSGRTLQSNELLYIENAMCEYAHANFSKCLTSTPSKANCNNSYRRAHYLLTTIQINKCEAYIADIKAYIKLFNGSIFPKKYRTPAMPTSTEPILHMDYSGGHANGQKTSSGFVVLKGSTINLNTTNSCPERAIKDRQKYASDIDSAGVLKSDIPFPSPSAAAAFIGGSSLSGNAIWKDSNGVTLKVLYGL